jgi:uncharacterized membrane protein
MGIRIRTVVVLLALLVLHGLKLPPASGVLSAATPHGKPGAGIGSLSVLPSLGGNSEAVAVNAAGTTIVGSSYDHHGLQHAVKWTLKQGAWTLTDLPWPPGVASVTARGVNNHGDVAGNTNTIPSVNSRAILWPITGNVSVLGCSTDVGPTSVYGISANGQTVVGNASSGAALWQPGKCLVSLPTLIPSQYSSAGAVNGDGTIIGGSVSTDPTAGVPVRWTLVAGQWQVEQLDALTGTVWSGAANAAGDLAGYVYVSCALADGCQRAAIWYAAGGSQVLGTLGGDTSSATGINATGEVVGISTPTRASQSETGFFWSESTGMVPLAFTGKWAAAWALSDVRPDGTRLVVGTDARVRAVVWVIANP